MGMARRAEIRLGDLCPGAAGQARMSGPASSSQGTAGPAWLGTICLGPARQAGHGTNILGPTGSAGCGKAGGEWQGRGRPARKGAFGAARMAWQARSDVEAPLRKARRGAIRQARSTVARPGTHRHGMLRHGRYGLACKRRRGWLGEAGGVSVARLVRRNAAR